MYSKIKLTKRSFIISNKSTCKICSKGHSVCSMCDAILRAFYEQLPPRLAHIRKRVIIFFDNVRSMTLQDSACVLSLKLLRNLLYIVAIGRGKQSSSHAYCHVYYLKLKCSEADILLFLLYCFYMYVC